MYDEKRENECHNLTKTRIPLNFLSEVMQVHKFEW